MRRLPLASPCLLSLSILATSIGGCASGAEVRPAPLEPDRASQLACTLQGHWQVTAVDGEPAAQARSYHFEEDGTGRVTAAAEAPLRWRLDGRNLHVEEPAEVVVRVDVWSDFSVEWFDYAAERRVELQRQGMPRACAVSAEGP